MEWLLVFMLLACLLVASMVLGQAQHEEVVNRRLYRLLGVRRGVDDAAAGESSDRLGALLSSLNVFELIQFKEREKLKAKLLLAGFDSEYAFSYLVFSKILLALLVAVVFYSSQEQMGFTQWVWLILLAVLANTLPERFVKNRLQANLQTMTSQLPQAIDLIIICVESGLTIDEALLCVGEAIDRHAPLLSRELLRTQLALQMPGQRREAWLAMASRNPIDAFENMAYLLIQSEQYGTPVGAALRHIASDSREHQMMKLEEKVGRIPGMMSVPLILFIMIPIIVMLGGPALMSLYKTLGGS